MPAVGLTLWFTGLPCSGKTTVAEALKSRLALQGLDVRHLDGDEVRRSISKDLGYSRRDRLIQSERVAALAAALAAEGKIVLVSLISPYRAAREAARKKIGSFLEIYVRCPLSVCEGRDSKGLYRKARLGEIRDFTGVSDVYEAPENADIVVDTDRLDVRTCVSKILTEAALHPRPKFKKAAAAARL